MTDELEDFDPMMDPSVEFVRQPVELLDPTDTVISPQMPQATLKTSSQSGPAFTATFVDASGHLVPTSKMGGHVTFIQQGAHLAVSTGTVSTGQGQIVSVVTQPTQLQVASEPKSLLTAAPAVVTPPAAVKKTQAIVIRQPPSKSPPTEKDELGNTKSGRKATVVRRKKDPNAPSAALTAYRAFFKETGQTVKTHNPAAKFGDVSRIVAGMWESMADSEKAIYRRMSDDDKIRYNREMEEYKKAGKAMAAQAEEEEEEEENLSPGDDQSTTSVVFTSTSTTPSVVNVTISSQPNPDDITENRCIRNGCTNNAIRSLEWEDEYCSNDCVVKHCGNVFDDWILSNLKEQNEMA